DQSACGSCWAFGTVEAFNDRLCIKSGGKFTEMLSAGEMNACCTILHGCLSFGCNGGNPMMAWIFLKTNGIVTGGNFDPSMKESDGCWPYDFKPCAHHAKEPDYEACPEKPYSTPSCSSNCHNKQYGTPFDQWVKSNGNVFGYSSPRGIATTPTISFRAGSGTPTASSTRS
ncbi:hypothetical protein FOZ62_011614, partial [Perkinsus olseni]